MLLRLLAALLLALPLATADPPGPGRPNRLANETSVYLLQHARNPVDWFPWGPEAFAKAKQENKLIFLSVGYSACHWCHVMERQSFKNAEIAKFLNDHFVCIKVDREERPDVDAVYQAVLQAQGTNGGWPMSLFLLPDGKPVGGGTYWPPEDREIDGKRVFGFRSIAKLVHDDWVGRPDAIKQHADRLADATRRVLALHGNRVDVVPLEEALVLACVDALKEKFDPVHGGFGSPEVQFRGPKFPKPPVLLFLLEEWAKSKDKDLERVLTLTLDRMAAGGIHDQLGGGFHRYTVDRGWQIPHFEKMLYDNGLLAQVYARACEAMRRPEYRQVVERLLAFTTREMLAPGGAFYAALDAQSDGGEGKFYVWSPAEVAAALTPAERALATAAFGLDLPANFERKAWVLWQAKPLNDVARAADIPEMQAAEALESIRRKLFSARELRPRPRLDTKILTGWNGFMIAGYADAGRILERRDFIDTAAKAATYLLNNLVGPDGKLKRTLTPAADGTGAAKIDAYLEDYTGLVHGLLALHDATQEARWLTQAVKLTDAMLARFEDKEHGGLFFTAHDAEPLFVRAKDSFDGSTPSANSLAVLNLLRLAKKTGEAKYLAEARRCLTAFAPTLKAQPTALATMAQSLRLALPPAAPPLR